MKRNASSERSRVIIAGGGLGGIALAVGLLQEGLEPIVVEQARVLGQVGAGVSFSPNALRAVTYLGCDAAVRRTAVVPERTQMHGLDGRLFSQVDNLALTERYGAPFSCIYRPDLLDALRGGLPEGRIRLGSKVAAFEETGEEVRVVLESGEELRGDALVGADGLHSVVREQLFGPEEAHFSGLAAWRGTVPTVGALERWSSAREIQFYAGAQGAILLYPLRRGELLNFVAVVHSVDQRTESWSLEGDPDELRRAFPGACDEVQSVLEAVEETFVTAFYDRPALESWGTARVTLLGDAAHPTSPSTGNGAAMALEDAITLAHCLGVHDGDVAGGLDEYARRRRPRTTKFLVQALHNNFGMFESLRDPAMLVALTGRQRGLARLDPEGMSLNSEPMGWLWGFDPVAALALPPEALETPDWIVANPMEREPARRAFELWRRALEFNDRPTWLSQRAGYERFCAREFPPPDGQAVEELDLGGVRALRVSSDAGAGGPTLLHLHGGGFVFGSAGSSLELAGRLADAAGGSAVVVDYRLAPEYPYPAALDDVLAAYRSLAAQVGPNAIIVSGENAGGGLAVSLACALRDAGEPLPAALYLVSPFCDLTLSAPQIDASHGRDPWLNRDFLTHLAACYIHTADPAAPQVSPVYGDLSGLPPLLIQAAASEALAGDSLRLAEVARGAGVETTLTLVEDSVHSFVLFDFLPETQDALGQLTALVGRTVGSPRPEREGRAGASMRSLS